MELEFNGPVIKELRRAKGWSLERLARSINRRSARPLSRSAVAQWESGATRPDMEHFCALALALGESDLNVFFREP